MEKLLEDHTGYVSSLIRSQLDSGLRVAEANVLGTRAKA
jgi:hypothetical protein